MLQDRASAHHRFRQGPHPASRAGRRVGRGAHPPAPPPSGIRPDRESSAASACRTASSAMPRAANQALARPMQHRHLIGVLGQQTCLENVGEEVVVAVPESLGVERHDEKVLPFEVLQHPAAVSAAGDGVAQGAIESVEDCGAEQEVADRWVLPGQHLVGQVVDDEAVAPGEGLDEVGDRRRDP